MKCRRQRLIDDFLRGLKRFGECHELAGRIALALVHVMEVIVDENLESHQRSDLFVQL
jgi:hypothetical protein